MSVIQPPYQAVPFGVNSTQINTIPQTSGTSGAASFDQGFPPETMRPITSGGIPPSGQDMNGVINYLSKHQVWMNAGGIYKYDATLATATGGYALGAVVQSNDGLSAYVSAVPGNMTDPNTGDTSWLAWSGAQLMKFKQAGAGSVIRTFQNKLEEMVSVLDFMTDADRINCASGAGTNNVTYAFNAAIATGRSFSGPKGKYLVDGGFVLSGNQHFTGEGCGLVTLQFTGTTGDLFVLSSDCSGVSGFNVQSASIRTSGSYVSIPNPTRQNLIKDFWFNRPHTGISLSGHVAPHGPDTILSDISHGYITNMTPVTGRGYYHVYGNDIFMDKIVIMGTLGAEPLAGVHVINAGALVFKGVDCIACGTGWFFNPTDVTQSINYCFFDSCMADTCAIDGWNFNAQNGGVIYANDFVNCWSATNTAAGLRLAQSGGGSIDSVRFEACRILNNVQQGAVIGTGVNHVDFDDCDFAANSRLAPGFPAIAFGNVQNFRIANCNIGTNSGFNNPTQSYGIIIGLGSDSFIIVNNNLTGNINGAINDASGASNVAVSGNLGVKLTTAAESVIVAGQTFVTVNHGLAKAPLRATISVTQFNNAATLVTVDATLVTATQITFRITSAVGSDIGFSYRASCYPPV